MEEGRPGGGRRDRAGARAGSGRHTDWGRFVEAMLACTGTEPCEPWCAAFVAYVGSNILGRRWPLPLSASCDVIRLHGERTAMTVVTPERGDQFFVTKNANDATHVGFVTRVESGGTFRTCEGNTNDGGSREGDGVYRRQRGGPNDGTQYTFLRWRDDICTAMT